MKGEVRRAGGDAFRLELVERTEGDVLRLKLVERIDGILSAAHNMAIDQAVAEISRAWRRHQGRPDTQCNGGYSDGLRAALGILDSLRHK